MKRQALLAFFIELLWILLIACTSLLAVVPIWKIISFDFLLQNFLLGLLFFYLFRVVIFFRQLAFLQFFPLQIFIFLAAIPVAFFIVNHMQEMLFIFDTYDISLFLSPSTEIKAKEAMGAFQFYKKEFLLFSIGSLILMALLMLRLISEFFKRVRKMK